VHAFYVYVYESIACSRSVCVLQLTANIPVPFVGRSVGFVQRPSVYGGAVEGISDVSSLKERHGYLSVCLSVVV
jgi:hypothetical protein